MERSLKSDPWLITAGNQLVPNCSLGFNSR